MIGWFPSMYPDELVYSLLARYAAHSGYSGYLTAAEELFMQPWINPSIDFLNNLTSEAQTMLCHQIPMENIIQQHTMYPCYVRFQKAEKRKLYMDSILSGKGNYHLFAPFSRKNTCQKRHAKYCPLCIQEDRETYGETYWHRVHQIPGIPLCPMHFCKLYNSSLQISDRPHHGLVTAEELYTETEEVISTDPVQRKLSEYLHAVFKAELPDTDVSIGQVLHSHLIGTPYVSPRGLKRDRVALRTDFSRYYGLIEGVNDAEPWMLDKMFSGARTQFAEICMMAMFLDIKPEELIQPDIPDMNRISECDARIRDLHEKGMKYPEIARRVGLSYDYVKWIGSEKKRNQRTVAVTSLSEHRNAPDWSKIDRETLPAVSKAIRDIYQSETRPARVTVALVARSLMIPVKQFDHLPVCLAEIRNHMETQAEFWAREVAWATEQVQTKGEQWCWTSIRRLTNMRRRDFATCFPYLGKYMDADHVALLKQLIIS